jgi:hypothetical protein
MHPLAIYFLIFPLAAQADLFKCTDNTGKVTYTNTSCAKAGLKEAKVIPPPPPPALDKTAKAAQPGKAAAGKPAEQEESKPRQTAALKVVKSAPGKGNACASLNTDMGRVMDEMDAARGQEPSAAQQSAWTEKLGKLQAEKSRLGCF